MGYYPQHPKVIVPVGLRRSQVDQKLMANDMSSMCNNPLVYEAMQQRFTEYKFSYSNQETLDLFPLHPTGILDGKTTEQVSSLVSVSADSSTDTHSASPDNNEDDACQHNQPFFDFFNSGQRS